MKGFGEGDYLVRKRTADGNDQFILGIFFHGKPTHHLAKKTDVWQVNKMKLPEAKSLQDVGYVVLRSYSHTISLGLRHFIEAQSRMACFTEEETGCSGKK